MAENPEIFTNTQKLEIARFRAELNGRSKFAVFNVAEDRWLIYDVVNNDQIDHHEDDADAETIDDCEYVDLWTS